MAIGEDGQESAEELYRRPGQAADDKQMGKHHHGCIALHLYHTDCLHHSRQQDNEEQEQGVVIAHRGTV